MMETKIIYVERLNLYIPNLPFPGNPINNIEMSCRTPCMPTCLEVESYKVHKVREYVVNVTNSEAAAFRPRHPLQTGNNIFRPPVLCDDSRGIVMNDLQCSMVTSDVLSDALWWMG